MSFGHEDIGILLHALLIVVLMSSVVYAFFIGITIIAKMLGLGFWECICVLFVVQFVFKTNVVVKK